MNRTRLIMLASVKILLAGSLLLSKAAVAEEFSIVVIPDTQNYSSSAAGAQISAAQTQWIADNEVAENIIYVAQLGDLVDSPAGCRGGAVEWARASAAMATLDTAGIPYSVLPGNHDFDEEEFVSDVCADTRENYNGITPGITGFGPTHFTSNPAIAANYGGNQDGSNNNNYTLFASPGGVEFISINLAYANAVAAEQTAILNWANTILNNHPDRRAIITSHYIVGQVGGGACTGGDTGTYGSAIVDQLVTNNPNVFMVMSGHCRGEKWITYTNTDPQRRCMADTDLMMSNYQEYDQQGNRDSGLMRIIRIDTTDLTNNVDVETFSPWINSPNPHPGPYPGCCTVATAGGMDQDSVATFSFTHDFNTPLSPSVVILLDTSGSMAWDVEGVSGVPVGEQRITFARQSSSAFLDLMSSILDNPQKVQFGLVGFPDSATPGSASADVLTPLTWLNPASRNQAVNVTLPGIIPNGGTPMLTGVEVAANLLEQQDCKSIVLLSDGYHNLPSPASVGDAVVENLINSIDGPANPVPVYAVSFGKKATVDYQLLEEIANRTDGEFYDATVADFNPASWDAATDLQAIFKNIVEDIFEEEIEMGVDPLDTINIGETKTFNMPINEHDTRASFFLSWRTLARNLLSLRLFDSNGNEVLTSEPGVSVIHGESYTIVTVDDQALHAKLGRIGKKPWHVKINAERLQHQESEPIQYSVLLRSGLKFSADIVAKANAAGDVITLTAKLTQGRRAITESANVRVNISSPTEGKGNWLVENHVTARQLANVPKKIEGETRQDHVRKAIYLADIAGINFPAQKAPKNLTLYDDGTHGDVKAKDGEYTNSFAATNREGLYSFHFQANGKTLAGNHFAREKMVQKYLSIHADADFIDVKAVKLPNTDKRFKRFDIVVLPRDSSGNYVGPGHTGTIRLSTKSGKFNGRLRDLLNGRYSQRLIIPRSIDERDVSIKLSVGDARKSVNLAKVLGFKKTSQ